MFSDLRFVSFKGSQIMITIRWDDETICQIAELAWVIAELAMADFPQIGMARAPKDVFQRA